MGGVGNGAAKEDWHGDLNTGAAAIPGRTMQLLQRLGPHSFWVLPFAMWLRQQERLCWEEMGRKDSCWWAMRRCHTALD